MSTWLTHLHWREPLWLLLAAVPWLALAWRQGRRPHDKLEDFADPPLLQRLLIGTAQRPIYSASLFLAWTLAAPAAMEGEISTITAISAPRCRACCGCCGCQ